mgnify:CR=1 FL=1
MAAAPPPPSRSLTPLTAQAVPRASILRFNTAGVNGICLRYDPESEQPDDVKAVARPAIRHRLQLHPAALIEGVSPDDIVTEILQQTEVPR